MKTGKYKTTMAALSVAAAVAGFMLIAAGRPVGGAACMAAAMPAVLASMAGAGGGSGRG